MNIRDLKYIVAVADFGHFGKAAEHCHVSQPTLSGQVKKLEEELGVVLFERTNRRVMLTPYGEKIVNSARRILKETEHIKSIAANAHDPLAGDFRLGAFPTLSTYIFPKIVPELAKALPELRLILIEEKTEMLIQKLIQGDIDAAYLALPVEDNFLVARHLFDDPFFLAVPQGHALAKEKEIQQEMLQHQSLLLLEEGHCLRDQALDVCQMHQIGEEQDFRATGLETLRQMVKAGSGITFMPEIAIKEQEEGISYVPFAEPAPFRSIALVRRVSSTRLEVFKQLCELTRNLYQR